MDFPAFPMSGLQNFRGFLDNETAAARDVTTRIDESLTYRRDPARRRMLDLRRTSNAAKALERLPEPGEAFHMVMSGNFNAWDFVPAILALAAPSRIRWLGIATLGYNRDGVDALTALLDAGKVEAVDFICSAMFRSLDAKVFDYLTTALKERGQRVVAIRSHCKLLLFELTDGRCLAAESSANLRSCRYLEQFTLVHDRGLLEFHRGWMREVIDAAWTKANPDQDPESARKLAGKRPRRRAAAAGGHAARP